MSYQALARKWRPRQFADLVGQEHVLRALVHALDNDRLHHAYLFTGTRGVGKTTIARILAKALNCERGVSSTPCGECGACRDLDEGRFVDLLEIDAASRTKVEDTRELMENVQYSPARGRYKVYLIDEVHMLSNHSFNALLKTLEEPPPHVKFLLATTDPQKLPVTVLSRCLQFNLKRLPASLIRQRLKEVTDAEGIASDAPSLELLARAADGSLRDALSLLDQAAAFGDGRLEERAVSDMLGTVDREHAARLLDAVAAADGPAVLEEVARLDERVPDYDDVLETVGALLQRAAMLQVAPELDDDEDGLTDRARGFAARTAAEDLQLWYQIALAGRRDLPLAPTQRAGFEMTLLRMLAFRPGPAARQAPAAGTPVARAEGRAAAGRSRRPASQAVAATPAREDGREDWEALVGRLELAGAARQLARHCAFGGRDGSQVRLTLDPAHESLATPAQQESLRAALERHFGAPLKLQIQIAAAAAETPAAREQRDANERQRRAVASIQADPVVSELQQVFDATVDPASIRPVDRQEGGTR